MNAWILISEKEVLNPGKQKIDILITHVINRKFEGLLENEKDSKSEKLKVNCPE